MISTHSDTFGRARPWMLLCLLACLSLAVPAAMAQVRVTGTVVDASTGSSLPAATVGIAGTERGVITNREGAFYLLAPDVPFTLEVRFIGYQTERLEVTALPGGPIRVALRPISIFLDELVVSGENPADRIMRQVIEAKQGWRKNVSSAYADTYTRFMLYRELDLVQMSESVRASWWTRDAGSRELVRALRKQPTGSGTFTFAEPHVVVNFYDDEIELLGTTYAGPTHPDALELYSFLLGGTRQIDGQRVYDIYFSPQSPTKPAFSGHVAVLDSAFVLLEVNVRPMPQTMVTPPIQRHDLYFEQRFRAVRDTVWMPLDMYVAGVVEFGRVGAAYPPARYEQFSSQSLHVVNPPVPDSFRVDGPAVRFDPQATRNTHLFLRNPSLVPMTPREMEDMAAVDPSMTLERAFRPKGLLTGYTAVNVTKEAEEAEEVADSQQSLVERISRGDWFWYNRVDGWHPGVGWGSGPTPGLQYQASVGYSTLRRRMSYNTELDIPWGGRRLGGHVGGGFLDATAVVAREDDLGRFIPGMATYLGYEDRYDYYHRRGAFAQGSVRPLQGPVLFSARMRWEVHASLRKLSKYEGWLFTREQPPNPSVNDGHLRSMEFGVSFGRSPDRALDLSVEHSPGEVLASDYTFTRYEGRATVAFETFFRNRARPNRMRITALGGTRLGVLPIQRQFTLGGSAGPFSDYTGFRTLGNGRFVSTELLGVFWYHDFTTALFEKAGLWWLAQSGMGLHVFGGHAFTTKEAFTETDRGRYHELGAGLSYPFGLPFRVDVATGTDKSGFSVRIGRPLK